MAKVEKPYISLDECAAMLGIGRNTVFQAAHAGQIPTVRVGRRILVPVAKLDQLPGGTGGVHRMPPRKTKAGK